MEKQAVSIIVLMQTFAITSAAVDYSCVHSSAWKMNDGHTSSLFSNTLTDVTSSSLASGKWSVSTNRIPNYEHAFTASEVSTLNSRPKASTDFNSGQTTVSAGTTVEFGQNIGYKANTGGCSMGYWPPGPGCPTKSALTYTWDLQPAPETKSGGCYIPVVGSIGVWVNGVSIFGWSDAQSYNNGRVWYNCAAEFEVYDLDVCNGHAANGEYHHHHYPRCLQQQLGDTGTGHSPVYGWALDSFPIHGPYQAAGVFAKSCWLPRDYSASSPTGCSTGTRCCTLKDPEDYTKGTNTVSCGPSLTGTVTTLSSNTISAASGIYVNDYYYDSTCGTSGGEHLDQHNGHDHDNYGYHYHVTTDSTGDAIFPYIIGPKFYGCRSTSCCTNQYSSTCSGTSVCGSEVGTSSHACSAATTLSSPTAAPTSGGTSPTAPPTASPSSSAASHSRKDGLSPTNTIIVIVCCVVGGVLLFVVLFSLAKCMGGASSGAVTAHPVAVPQHEDIVEVEAQNIRVGSDVQMVAVDSIQGVKI